MKTSPPDLPQLSDLVKCTKWEDVEKLFGRLQGIPEGEDLSPEIKSLFLVRRTVGAFSPEYDLEQDSIQRRILDYFSDYFGKFQHARRAFRLQEKRRLFAGFESACEYEFGFNWRTHPDELLHYRLISQIESLGYVPDFLEPGSHLNSALCRGDADYILKVGNALKRAQISTSNESEDNRARIQSLRQE